MLKRKRDVQTHDMENIVIVVVSFPGTVSVAGRAEIWAERREEVLAVMNVGLGGVSCLR